MDKKSTIITTEINESFYYNQSLQLPTVVREYQNIERILTDLQYLACISIRISHLTLVEYQYGSNIYNLLLVKITELLKRIKAEEFRTNDILLVDLFDSDTFIIFLSAPRDARNKLIYHIEMLADRIRTAIENEIFEIFYPYCKEFSRPYIGFSIEINNPMVNNMRLIMQLISNAKKMGEFFNKQRTYMAKFNLQKIIIEQNIRTLFQPIVDMQTLEVIGYEALTRGPKDTEFANPLLMFIIAGECGLSFELDRLCRKKALERVPRLNTDKMIFVNTLSMTIHDPEFRGIYLKEILEDLKIKPENVVFEVSEKLAIDNYDIFREALKDYTDIGIVHAGDDMGTGYSDLERIMELNPGYLKIDISFVREIDKSYIKQEIVRALVNLSKSIGSQVIVEGIETKAEYETLKRIGAPFGQGYLFARPSETLEPIRKDF